MIVKERMSTMKRHDRALTFLAVVVVMLALGGVTLAQDPVFEIQAPGGEAYYPVATPESATFTGSISIQQTAFPDGGSVPAETTGYSLGVAHDPAILSINTAITVVTSASGEAVEFEVVNIYIDGVTQGVVYDFLLDWSLPLVDATPVLEIEYQLQAGVLTGATSSSSTTLNVVSTLGDPPVDNVVVVDGASVAAVPVDGTLILTPYEGSQFIRGDVTQNGSLDVADGIGVLSYLFLFASTTCFNALDADDTGNVSISDAVRILCAVFCPGSPAPEAPYPGCGVDIATDAGSCDAYASCP
jgi:hypothetical protein